LSTKRSKKTFDSGPVGLESPGSRFKKVFAALFSKSAFFA
jgi:hypothetical protein